jgi:hypothetical protein
MRAEDGSIVASDTFASRTYHQLREERVPHFNRREEEATDEDRREWAAEDKHDLEKEGGWEP